MDVKIRDEWKQLLQTEFDKPYFEDLTNFIRNEYKEQKIYPPAKLIFNAFDSVAPNDIKVVILGQDPYHGEGQAHGLSFSVPHGIAIPKSLINIYKEIETDLNISTPKHGNLERWAKQGVFLLNASLTVRAGSPASHQGCGWTTFTDNVIKTISDHYENIIFMLWGNFAKQKKILINEQKHLILTSVHPSPLSAHRGFFGCKHFSKANQYLIENNKSPIEW